MHRLNKIFQLGRGNVIFLQLHKPIWVNIDCGASRKSHGQDICNCRLIVRSEHKRTLMLMESAWFFQLTLNVNIISMEIIPMECENHSQRSKLIAVFL